MLGGATDAYSEPMANEAEQAAGPEVERFAPPAGRLLGYVAVVVGLVLAVGSALAGVTTNRGVMCFGIAVVCVAWVVLIRPVVAAHEHGVLLRNMARDVFVPWSGIQRARVLQTLQLVTSESTYHGLGVTRSARSMLKDSRRGAAAAPTIGLGSGVFGRGYTPRDAELTAVAKDSGISYQSYVESRLQALVAQHGGGARSERATVSWVPLPIVALAVTVLCVIVIFLP
jgi:Bacterial PH domain